jgi:8-oxo-dGTP pyrophosphatase MutT (NUDIX family)
MDPSPAGALLHRLLDDYAALADAQVLAQFRALLALAPGCYRRDCWPGHFTGAAWLVSPTGGQVLLTHHRKLDRWLQLGGHADGDSDLGRVALREATEESGLDGLALEPAIFDLDRHWIPPRAPDPGHWHYDVRFVVRATHSTQFVVSAESKALEWRDVAAIANDARFDDSMRRMSRNWLTIIS